MNRETYRKIEEYMQSCMKDAAHDRDHVYRVLYVGLDIASTEPAVDYDVLIPALLLHDIGRPEQSADPAKDHAEVGARKAYAFLTAIGFSADKARHVSECIYTHRFRNGHRPATIEAKILFDADKVDVSGAIGIARTLQYSGTFSEPLYTLLPDGTPNTFAVASDNTPNTFTTSTDTTKAATEKNTLTNALVNTADKVASNTRDAAPDTHGAAPNHAAAAEHNDAPDSFLREYNFKLRKIYDNFYTRRAHEIAASRRAAAAAFHAALTDEITSTFAAGLAALNALLDD